MFHRLVGWHAPAMRRLAVAALVGAVVGAAVAVAAGWQLALLSGWDATALTFLAAVSPIVLRANGEHTRRLAVSEDLNRDLARLLLLAASGISLGAVALVLRAASDETGADRVVLVSVAALTIVVSWTVVNTLFTLRYASLYYGAGAGARIDFGAAAGGGGEGDGVEPPDYRDFAYLAFTIGMTYQVSDTTLRSRPLRRSVLAHAMVAYVFGVVIVSTVVNVVASLLR